jgi:hypothetical protein
VPFITLTNRDGQALYHYWSWYLRTYARPRTQEGETSIQILFAEVVAHARQAGIPFEIYERDADVDARGQGWAITLHWVLPFLQDLLEPEVYRALDDIQVDPEVGRNDTGNFLFINLATEEARFKIPSNSRKRVGREKMRKLLLDGVKDHVRWNSKLVDIATSDEGATAIFEDGHGANGMMLVGAEGTNSRTREFLCPESYRTYQLPVRFVGVAIGMTTEEVEPLRKLDPLLFQGSHPDTGTFLWVSYILNGMEYFDLLTRLPGVDARSASNKRHCRNAV